MSESKTGQRPSQVTMAGWVAVVGSALLVLTLFDSMSQLRSIEMRESVEEFLSSSPGSGLGLTVAGAVEIIRGLMLVNGAAAAAAMVLGVYVLQRNKGARLGFTIAAMAIMVTAPVAGGFLPVLIAFAAFMLWTGPARDWFAGSTRAPRAATAKADRERDEVSSKDPTQSSEGTSDDSNPTQHAPPATDQAASGQHPPPPPTEGFGTPPPPYAQQQPPDVQGGQSQPSSGWAPPPYAQQPQQPQPHQYGDHSSYPQRDPDKRPTTVTIAALLTWFFGGVTLLAFGVVVLVLLVAQEEFLDQVRQEQAFRSLSVSTDDLLAGMWVVSAVVIFWCLAAIVLAVFAWRRSNGARITLVVSAASAALFSLGAFPVGLVHTVAAGATVALLFLGGANRWFSRKPSFDGYPPYGGPQQGQPYGGPQQYGAHQGAPQQGDQQEPPRNVW